MWRQLGMSYTMDTFRKAVKEKMNGGSSEASEDTYPEKLTTGYYRVRKTWNDKKSQIGAYRVLINAKTQADKNKGYYVFNDSGKQIYPVSTSPVFREYTVIKGDSLWAIAQKLLGSGLRYPEIVRLNGLTSNIIYSGQKLKISN